jgi:integrase
MKSTKDRFLGPSYLRPEELTKLLACEAVPLKCREAYALSVYLCLRSLELVALKWADVALEDGGGAGGAASIRVRGGVRSRRIVPISPKVLPLLHAMHAGRPSEDESVMGAGSSGERSSWTPRLRKHLVFSHARKSLCAGTDDETPVAFHWLRRTGAHLLTESGAPHDAIARLLGVKAFRLEQRTAPIRTDLSWWDAFPPIPECLVRASRTARSNGLAYA